MMNTPKPPTAELVNDYPELLRLPKAAARHAAEAIRLLDSASADATDHRTRKLLLADTHMNLARLLMEAARP